MNTLKGTALLAAAATVLMIPGCSSVGPKIVLKPAKQEVVAGETLKVAVAVTNPKPGLVFRWSAEAGDINPGESEQLYAMYKAPEVLEPDSVRDDRIHLEVLRGGKVIAQDDLMLKVTKRKDNPQPAQPVTGQPTLTITDVPERSDKGDPVNVERIAGRTSGASRDQYVVVCYCWVGNKFWVQPTVESPYTEINPDGSWSTLTHPGIEFYALLVRKVWKAPATFDALPERGGDIVAIASREGR